MGLALLRSWLAAGVPPSNISVLDPKPSPQLLEVAASTGIGLNPAQPKAELVVLAVKPQLSVEISKQLEAVVNAETLLISVMAGLKLERLSQLFPLARTIIRAMPNLPAAVGRGATVAVMGAGGGEADRRVADTILGAAGTLLWLEEEHQIDAATAISGSGPAYYFHFTECLAAAGIEAGLPPAIAESLARMTMVGAGEMQHCNPQQTPTQLREAVTSPNGTTAAALEVLMGKKQLATIVSQAVSAAQRRSLELSAQ